MWTGLTSRKAVFVSKYGYFLGTDGWENPESRNECRLASAGQEPGKDFPSPNGISFPLINGLVLGKRGALGRWPLQQRLGPLRVTQPAAPVQFWPQRGGPAKVLAYSRTGGRFCASCSLSLMPWTLLSGCSPKVYEMPMFSSAFLDNSDLGTQRIDQRGDDLQVILSHCKSVCSPWVWFMEIHHGVMAFSWCVQSQISQSACPPAVPASAVSLANTPSGSPLLSCPASVSTSLPTHHAQPCWFFVTDEACFSAPSSTPFPKPTPALNFSRGRVL